jgi:hypothetical protein
MIVLTVILLIRNKPCSYLHYQQVPRNNTVYSSFIVGPAEPQHLPPIADEVNSSSLQNSTFWKAQSAVQCVNKVVKYGSIDALRVTQPPHWPFHPILGPNLGSRKQKLQPYNSGLSNKDMVTHWVSHILYFTPVWSYEQKPKKRCR